MTYLKKEHFLVLSGFLIHILGIFPISWAQDERFFKETLMQERPAHVALPPEKKRFFYKITTPKYSIDINGDGLNEILTYEKRDGEDWFNILDHDKRRLLRLQLRATGIKSKLYRIGLHQISRQTRLLILHFYEGYNEYLEFNGGARYYFVTLDNNDLKTLSGHRGPLFLDERKERRGHYHLRNLHLSLYDHDNDGVKEVAVKHHLVSKIFKYRGNGQWLEL